MDLWASAPQCLTGMLFPPGCTSILDLYAQVHRGKRIQDDNTNPLINALRVSGIIRTTQGLLTVRNQIYRKIFDRAWITANMPDAERRRQRKAFWRGVLRTGAIALVVLAVMGGLVWYANEQTKRADAQAQRAERNLQNALQAANTLVQQLVYGLQPLLGSRSRDLERILNSVEQVFTRLFQEAGDSAEVQHGMAAMFSAYSDIYRQLGDLPRALERAWQLQQAMERLAAQDPHNAQWQRDLSVSHNKVGEVFVAQGNLPNALTAYQDSLIIFQRLAAQDLDNAGWQRTLSVSHHKVGNVLRAQGNLPEALKAYQAAQTISQRLTTLDSTNAEWQRDLEFLSEQVSELLLQQGNTAK